MTLLNKFKNEQNRQLQIQAQLAEQSYRAFNGVKQSRENERSGELRKKINDDLPASSLTKDMIRCSVAVAVIAGLCSHLEKRPLGRGKRWIEKQLWFLEGVEEGSERAPGSSRRQLQ